MQNSNKPSEINVHTVQTDITKKTWMKPSVEIISVQVGTHGGSLEGNFDPKLDSTAYQYFHS